jgi:hypothetical protein
VDVALGIQQDVVGLDISMDDALLVDIPQGATQLRYPEPHSVFRKALPRDMKSQVSTVHQIDHEIPAMAC